MDGSGDEDADLKLAIAMSLQETLPPAAATTSEQSQYAKCDIRPEPKESIKPPVMASKSDVMLDRKQMELERLSRLKAKRPRSISPPPIKRHTTPSSERELKRLKMELVPGNVDLDADAKPPSLQNMSSKTAKTSQLEASSQPQNAILEYPFGVVKKTWAFRHERFNDIKIQEVLQKNTLNIAVLSAFDWDVDWVLRKLDLKRTKMIFVMQAKGKKAQEQYREDSKDIPNLKLCFPDMSGQINCMHSKLMLLFHETHLRVAVPTANLNAYDWGETGIMENSVFLVDLPRRVDQDAKVELTPFAKDLVYFAQAKGLSEEVISGLLKFDYSNTGHLAFVHTIGGTHYGEALKRTGIPGLSRAVRSLKLETNTLEVDFTASSIGSLNDTFLKNVYLGAKGELPPNIIARDVPKSLHDKFRIYFPLHDTILQTTGGPDCAGTNCLQSSYYNNSRFPKECMHDYKSARTGLLSHNKILFARGQRKSKDGQSTSIAWAYVGSANVSESAWGRLLMDKSKKVEKLNCRNWECGVLIAVPPATLDMYRTLDGSIPMDVFAGLVDVPFRYPGEKYGTKKPWFFMERKPRVP